MQPWLRLRGHMTVGGVVLVCDDCAGHYQLRITSQIQSSHTKRAVGDCN